ncbi:hypothetical protein O181_028808 [Austropuccinia psidii MF-1]|uniref:Uncharacterized protein n=1 Tax=Austropuccinia psidii MF-1 TaxID=1389203 RepID=A0A9Q3CSC5_9BASI|nr:hypothetical protein [Austropuccinia psidii MF-1]
MVSSEFWAKGFSMALFIIDRTPIASIGFDTPIGRCDPYKLHDLPNLHSFVSTEVMHLLKQIKKSELDSAGTSFILNGIQDGENIAWLFNPKSSKVHITNDCVFVNNKALWTKHPIRNKSNITPISVLSF